ncbi:FecR family protein [Sphingomonas sp.]|uniref:FecR family protein n=1 Tax=Sphingomonas sp. TaxID=28214 RepID=UPI002EDA58DF
MPGGEDAREEATRWWGRMHGPHAEESRAEFERWRAADPRNAAEYAALERTWTLAEGLGATAVGRDRSLKPQPRPLAWATAPRLALAAAAMIVIALFVTLQPGRNPNLSLVSVAHATSVGEIRTVKLPDGSSVTLDTDTRVEVAFDEKVRKVRLQRGRARFDIRPDPARPFLVEAGGKVVSAPEADFDVQAPPAGLSVVSLRGALEVRRTGDMDAPADLRIQPGQAMRFAASGEPLAPAGPAGKGSDQWVSGMLVFHGAPLSAVLEETNRYASPGIALGEPSLGAVKVTGAFRPLPVDQLAASLAAALELRVRRDANGNLTLVRP